MREYSRVIDKNLDIVEVMKELNGLKVINRAVFQDHHLELMPDLLTEMEKKDEEEESKQDPSFEMSRLEYAKSGQNQFFSRESMFFLFDFNSFLDQDSISKSPMNQYEGESQNFSLQRPRSSQQALRRRGMTISGRGRSSMAKAIQSLKNSKPKSQLEASVNEIFKGYLGIKSTSGPSKMNQRTEIKNPSLQDPGSIRSIASPGISNILNSEGENHERSAFSPRRLRSRGNNSKVLMGRRGSNRMMNKSGIKFRKAKVFPLSKASIFQKESEPNENLEK